MALTSGQVTSSVSLGQISSTTLVGAAISTQAGTTSSLKFLKKLREIFGGGKGDEDCYEYPAKCADGREVVETCCKEYAGWNLARCEFCCHDSLELHKECMGKGRFDLGTTQPWT